MDGRSARDDDPASERLLRGRPAARAVGAKGTTETQRAVRKVDPRSHSQRPCTRGPRSHRTSLPGNRAGRPYCPVRPVPSARSGRFTHGMAELSSVTRRAAPTDRVPPPPGCRGEGAQSPSEGLMRATIQGGVLQREDAGSIGPGRDYPGRSRAVPARGRYRSRVTRAPQITTGNLGGLGQVWERATPARTAEPSPRRHPAHAVSQVDSGTAGRRCSGDDRRPHAMRAISNTEIATKAPRRPSNRSRPTLTPRVTPTNAVDRIAPR